MQHSYNPMQEDVFTLQNYVFGRGCFITSKHMQYYLLTWRDHHLKQLKDQIRNAQNRRYGEISGRVFEMHKYSVRPHGCHIYNIATEMDMETMCNCSSTGQGLTNRKIVLRCCDR